MLHPDPEHRMWRARRTIAISVIAAWINPITRTLLFSRIRPSVEQGQELPGKRCAGFTVPQNKLIMTEKKLLDNYFETF